MMLFEMSVNRNEAGYDQAKRSNKIRYGLEYTSRWVFLGIASIEKRCTLWSTLSKIPIAVILVQEGYSKSLCQSSTYHTCHLNSWNWQEFRQCVRVQLTASVFKTYGRSTICLKMNWPAFEKEHEVIYTRKCLPVFYFRWILYSRL